MSLFKTARSTDEAAAGLSFAVATAGVPEDLRQQVRDALCDLGRQREIRDVLASGLIRRFTPIDDSAYDDIRQVLAVVDQRRAPSNSAGTR